MIPVEDAISIVLANTPRLPAEEAPLHRVLGRVLAQTAIAGTDLPPFNRAQMDGYAVRSVDTLKAPVRLAIVGEAAAGRGWRGEVKQGHAVRIMTGAPVPEGADGVQKVELTRERPTEAAVEIKKQVEGGQHILPRGSEIK